MRHLFYISALACACLVAPSAWADSDDDGGDPQQGGSQSSDTRPASPRGVVAIEIMSGSVEVTGWARNEVEVKGLSGAPMNQFSVEKDRTTVRTPHADVEIHVPAGSSVEIHGAHIDAQVRAVTGALRFDAMAGNLDVSGALASVSAKTASGDITINASSPQTTVRTVSGDIHIRGARGSAILETVSGQCSLTGGVFNQVTMRSTQGELAFDGQLASQGILDVNSHAGDVKLLFPASASANFDLRSYNGSIKSSLGGQRSAENSLTFKTGTGAAIVRAQTFSGDIDVDVHK